METIVINLLFHGKGHLAIMSSWTNHANRLKCIVQIAILFVRESNFLTVLFDRAHEISNWMRRARCEKWKWSRISTCFFSVKNANECAQCSSCPGQCHHTEIQCNFYRNPWNGSIFETILVWIIGKILTPFILNKLSIFQLHFTSNDTQIFAKNFF